MEMSTFDYNTVLEKTYPYQTVSSCDHVLFLSFSNVALATGTVPGMW